MFVSVIIPVYNVEPFIGRCIQSVKRQIEGVDGEVILVDDCGSDNSLAIAHEVLGDSPNVRIVKHERNRGLSAARNTGLSVANGDYVLFVDSDDILADDCISKFIELKEEYPDADVIVGQFDEFEEEGSCHTSKWKQHGGLYVNDVIVPYLNWDIPVTAWNKLCRRSFLLENDLTFEEGLVHEDALWSFQVACMAHKVVVADKVTYHYRQRKGSLDKQDNTLLHLEHYVRVNALQCQFVFKTGLEHDSRLYRFLDQQRYQLLADACKADAACARRLYRLLRGYPYWTLYQRTVDMFVSIKIWLRALHWSLPVNLGFSVFKSSCK